MLQLCELMNEWTGAIQHRCAEKSELFVCVMSANCYLEARFYKTHFLEVTVGTMSFVSPSRTHPYRARKDWNRAHVQLVNWAAGRHPSPSPSRSLKDRPDPITDKLLIVFLIEALLFYPEQLALTETSPIINSSDVMRRCDAVQSVFSKLKAQEVKYFTRQWSY